MQCHFSCGVYSSAERYVLCVFGERVVGLKFAADKNLIGHHGEDKKVVGRYIKNIINAPLQINCRFKPLSGYNLYIYFFRGIYV